jgi:hypothetical protein
MTQLIVMDGQKFGRLTVGEHAGKNRFGNALWTVKCDCGSPAFVVILIYWMAKTGLPNKVSPIQQRSASWAEATVAMRLLPQ